MSFSSPTIDFTRYKLSPDQLEAYHRDGYILIDDVFSSGRNRYYHT
jgi:hypothetical protein